MLEGHDSGDSEGPNTWGGVLVFDIETIPMEFDGAALEAVEQLAQKQAARRQEDVDVDGYCSLSPPLAAVCSVSMLKYGASQKAVYCRIRHPRGAAERQYRASTNT
jgi:hypothetical protein